MSEKLAEKQKIKAGVKLRRKKDLLSKWDRRLRTGRSRFWSISKATLTQALNLLSRHKISQIETEPPSAILETNVEFQCRIEPPDNFYTDLLSQYLPQTAFAFIIAFTAGYYYKFLLSRFLLLTLSKGEQISLDKMALVIAALLIPCLVIILCAIIFSAEEKFNLLTKDVNQNVYWLSKNEIIHVHKMLPWSLSEPEIESANWFNEILSRLWPTIQQNLNKTLEKVLGVDLSLDFIGAANERTKFRITKSSLGKNVPNITGIRVMKNDFGELIIIDTELTYKADIDFRISGAFNLVAGITNFFFKCTVRIIVGPLLREKPMIGSIWLTLLTTPLIEWHFIGVLRFLNARWLMQLVSVVISIFLKSPKRVEINLAKFIPRQERYIPEPKGLLSVDVIEATNLIRRKIDICCFTKIDAYCVVYVGDEEKQTPAISRSDNPEWNTSFNFVYHKTYSGNVEFFVYDENFDVDELIGVAVIPVQQVIESYNGREFSIALRDP
ncbi:hypothetical protein B4U79_17666, partial [Dinothrombium tinctorium]